ncbi:MAG TPA: glycosyltransferase family 2 protein [Cytophagales bacterium]|nr:glycosyltransferase family 2 protein [Cytophagales bacterium]
MLPLVSIICLSYNHKPYIKEALDSVLNQTHQNIEIIVVDDASPDGSAEEIRKYLRPFPQIKFIALAENIGNCKAFNIGFRESKGKYVIDFAMDDVLLPGRIEKQVEVFEKLPAHIGVVFSDVGFIDKESRSIGVHYKRDKKGNLLEHIPQGNVYKELLERYFISPPSMMVKREVLEKLEGYDETLAYEDFDFWVRSSRIYQFRFIDEIQTLKRILPHSHGSKFNQKRQHFMLESTLKVCEKAFQLNTSKEENKALAKRIRFHSRQALFTENYSLVKDFYHLLEKLDEESLIDKAWLFLANLKMPFYWVYRNFR